MKSTEIFDPLRAALTKGESSDKVVWTPELIEHFKRSQLAMDELMALSPFDPSLPVYILVDSSALGTGAILYNKAKGGEIFWSKYLVVKGSSPKKPQPQVHVF